MNEDISVSPDEINALYAKLQKEAESGGYYLNPDEAFVKDLLKGMLVNEKRYGYRSCPCRLAAREKQADLDIICPCDYRDPDLDKYGCCYCALYVTGAVLRNEKRISSIPERRPPPEQRLQNRAEVASGGLSKLPLPVWRCRVCGYLCARDQPPEICPICKAKAERFERFI
ncbi:MAG: ferredoxin:glutaredoxin reductase [Dehalococcoidales bacterium]|nr:ferredoxin:glutaredoxin reductase [Dehalococcoidales bacterium]